MKTEWDPWKTPEAGPPEILHSVAMLAATVSHEINNPLMTMVANLELLERTQTLDAYGRARLGAALAAADQIKETIRRLGASRGSSSPPTDPICRRCSISRSRAWGRMVSTEARLPTCRAGSLRAVRPATRSPSFNPSAHAMQRRVREARAAPSAMRAMLRSRAADAGHVVATVDQGPMGRPYNVD
jgi:hypothetical protein